MCSQKVTDCSSYMPSEGMFNSTRPEPTKLGRILVCDASEDEIWTTEGRFKVGDEDHQPPESRTGCPCNPDSGASDCRRQAVQVGKLDFEREKVCGILIKKDMPSSGRDSSCSKWVEKVVPNSQGGEVDDCQTRFQ